MRFNSALKGSKTVHLDILKIYGVWGHSVRDYCKIDKAVLLQASGGPESSRKLKFPGFLTTAQDGGKVVSLTHRPHLPPGNTRGTHFC
jgi:hypothetical protein